MTLVVNLVRTVSSAKFICRCCRHPWCDCHVTHTPKCNELAKIGQIINCGWTILIVSVFPVLLTKYDTAQIWALLTKWPVFLQNAFGNRAYVNQTNLCGKLRKKLGGPNRGQAKIWGAMAHPGSPLESPLLLSAVQLKLWSGAFQTRTATSFFAD